MMKRLPDWLVVSIWRALLGEIYPHIRAIAVGLSPEKVLILRYYLDREPVDFDSESISVVAINVSSSLPLDLVGRIDVDCQYSSLPFGKLDCLDGLIYCRREYDLENGD
jgi:hypothetical protein